MRDLGRHHGAAGAHDHDLHLERLRRVIEVAQRRHDAGKRHGGVADDQGVAAGLQLERAAGGEHRLDQRDGLDRLLVAQGVGVQDQLVGLVHLQGKRRPRTA